MIHAVTDLRTGERTTYTISIKGELDGIVVSYRDASEHGKFMYELGVASGLEEALEMLERVR